MLINVSCNKISRLKTTLIIDDYQLIFFFKTQNLIRRDQCLKHQDYAQASKILTKWTKRIACNKRVGQRLEQKCDLLDKEYHMIMRLRTLRNGKKIEQRKLVEKDVSIPFKLAQFINLGGSIIIYMYLKVACLQLKISTIMYLKVHILIQLRYFKRSFDVVYMSRFNKSFNEIYVFSIMVQVWKRRQISA